MELGGGNLRSLSINMENDKIVRACEKTFFPNSLTLSVKGRIFN